MTREGPKARAEARALLSVKTGSRLIPILLMLLIVFLYIVHGLRPGNEMVAEFLAFPPADAKKITMKYLMERDYQDGEIAALTSGFDFKDYMTKLIFPVAKLGMDEFASNIRRIITTAFHTGWKLAAFSLVLGIAGLVYRRAFLSWFLSAFVILYGINVATGGSITNAEDMPLTGSIFFFALTVVILLLLANRLRRYSTSSTGWISARVHNWLLTLILLFAAVAFMWKLGPNAIWAPFGSDVEGMLYRIAFAVIALPGVYFLLRKSDVWSAKGAKNIVVCLDGTSNTPDQYELGLLAQTNVFKLFKMLKANGAGMFAPSGEFDASLCKKYSNKDKHQIAFYYTGVGNRFENDPIGQILGMATGLGASGIVDRAYLDVMRVYRPGDRVFIVGFSRGAAIARLLARAIDEQGAPKIVWTIRLFGQHWTLWESREKREVPISVLGCWDTVGSFGIAKTIAGINFQQMNMGKDLTVPETVDRAYHMVALDEQRDSFEPTLMDPDPITPERITEVWFTGDHANVGGGWATDKLSDVTLDFFLRHTSSGYAADPGMTHGNEDWGLLLDAVNAETVDVGGLDPDNVAFLHPDPLGQLRSWTSALYTYRPRKLPLHAVISDKVFDRMSNSLPVYAPQSLFNLNKELDTKRDTIDKEVARLAETASLSADERSRILEFKDRLRLTRWSSYQANLQEERGPTPPQVMLATPPPAPPSGKAPATSPAVAPPQGTQIASA
jgi:uncharacterized protein (DUF2235 family)/NADH:ubiquinone oxidoreductase subunit K